MNTQQFESTLHLTYKPKLNKWEVKEALAELDIILFNNLTLEQLAVIFARERKLKHQLETFDNAWSN